jgi:hypothetical protein
MMVSHDGGNTWTSQSMNEDCKMLFDIKMFDKNNGIVCAATHEDISQSNALLLKTSDGGKTWKKVYQSDRPFETTWKVSFPTAKIGYATVQSYNPDPAISQQRIVKTTDGGNTWQEVNLVNDASAREFGIGFIDEQFDAVLKDVVGCGQARTANDAIPTLGRIIGFKNDFTPAINDTEGVFLRVYILHYRQKDRVEAVGSKGVRDKHQRVVAQAEGIGVTAVGKTILIVVFECHNSIAYFTFVAQLRDVVGERKGAIRKNLKRQTLPGSVSISERFVSANATIE